MSMLTVAAPLACGLLATHGGVIAPVLHAPVFGARSLAPAMSVKSQEFYPTRDSVINADPVEVFKNPSIYKEATREFRRDVYSYKDWLWHRESGHVADAFMSVFTSSVSKWLWSEIFFVIVSAVAVLTYNDGLNAVASAVRDSSPDLAATLASRPILEINMLPLTLSSPALFLLLVFRTNSAYGRWWEARKVWGSIINTCRDSARMSLIMIEQNEIKEQAVSQVAVFSRVLKYHLREPSDQAEALLRSEIGPILKPEHTEKIMSAKHKPMTLCGLMSDTIHEAADGLTTVERLKLDQSVTLMVDYLGMCERIVKTPIPLVYTRHTARFLSWWLVFLPVCLYDQLPNNLLLVPVTAILAFFLLGIEDLGNQIEEPFSILPIEVMGDGISGSIFEALEMNTGEPKEFYGKPPVPYSLASSDPGSYVR